MKHVGIVFANAKNPAAMNFIRQNLEAVFERFVEFRLYYLEQFSASTVFHDDAYLMASEVPFEFLKKHVSDYSAIYALERSLPKTAIDQIMAIPEGTNVLVVNDGYDSAHEVIESFDNMGVGHLNMIPFDMFASDPEIYRDFTVAITPGESDLVPPHISHIVDIGYRKVSFGTMYMLMKFLDLDIPVINRNLFRHIQTIAEPDSAFHDNYKFSYLKGEMLDHIANIGSQAMLLIDSNYRSVYANRNALSLLQTSDLQTFRISEYISTDALQEKEAMSGEVKVNDINYHYDKYPFTLLDETLGYFITFQRISDVETASRQNVQKGYVARYQFRDIIRRSPVMEELISKISKISPTDFTVLIRGESGTGKELVAQSIHNASFRNKEPFVAINCAALPENLLESELFGYVPGAFTGAQEKGKIGLFEQANHGTIFLDEIGDISPKMQTQLLRVIQEKQIMRLGGDRLMNIDVRLITATNRDLDAAVASGSFRQDLYFRLNVLSFQLPPLRQRREDIPLLLEKYLDAGYRNLSDGEKQILQTYDWPGNIREIENVATYYNALCCLPDYLYQHHQIPAAETIANRISAENTLEDALLKLILAHTSDAHGIGRSAMLPLLKESGIKVSDGKLRKVLSDMEQRGLVEIGRGRSGTRITEAGIARLDL